MALPQFTMRQLLEAGVHFGHQKHRWNPKMAPYLFDVRNNIHIVDLSRTVPLLREALTAVRAVAASGGRVLFVGTKRAASEPIAQAARECAQYYVNHRWLGGMLTNWKTITKSIKRLTSLEETLDGEAESGLTKKERLHLVRERGKLERAIGGIRGMGGLPDLVFVIDTNKESIALQEVRTLNIPVMAVLDSNSDPDGVAYPVPGNDDSSRAIRLYCDLVSRAVLDGLSDSQPPVGGLTPATASVAPPPPSQGRPAAEPGTPARTTATPGEPPAEAAPPAPTTEAAPPAAPVAPQPPSQGRPAAEPETPARTTATPGEPTEAAPAETAPTAEAAPDAAGKPAND